MNFRNSVVFASEREKASMFHCTTLVLRLTQYEESSFHHNHWKDSDMALPLHQKLIPDLLNFSVFLTEPYL